MDTRAGQPEITTELVSRQLGAVLTAGHGKAPRPGIDIGALVSVCRTLADDNVVSDERVVEDVITEASSHLSQASTEAIEILFGLHEDVRHVKYRYMTARREKLAKVIKVDSPEYVRQTLEPKVRDELAAYLMRRYRERVAVPRELAPDTTELAPASVSHELSPVNRDGGRADDEATGGLGSDRSRAALADPGTRSRRTRQIAVGCGATVLAGVAVLALALGWLSAHRRDRLPTLATLASQASRGLTLRQTPVPGAVSPVLGWGDAAGGRSVIAYEDQTSVPSTPVLDSMVDVSNGIGDERYFLRTEVHAPSKTFQLGNRNFALTAKASKRSDIVWLWLYADNNAYPPKNCYDLAGPTVSTNTRARLAIWNAPSGRLHIIRAWIESNNASPRWITSAVAVETTHAVTLRLDPKISSEYSPLPAISLHKPDPGLAHTLNSAGVQIGYKGYLGSCWKNRAVLYLGLRQVLSRSSHDR